MRLNGKQTAEAFVSASAVEASKKVQNDAIEVETRLQLARSGFLDFYLKNFTTFFISKFDFLLSVSRRLPKAGAFLCKFTGTAASLSRRATAT